MKRSYMLHAAAVFLVTPQGIPLVKDPKKPLPAFWKLPGGRGPATETAEEVAIRELKEEIGVSLSKKDLKVIHQEDRGTHILTIFRADLPSLPKLKQQGDEGEQIEVFSPQAILSLSNFFPNHLKIIEQQLRDLLK